MALDPRDPYDPATNTTARPGTTTPVDRRRSNWGWAIGAVIVLLLVIWFAWDWGTNDQIAEAPPPAATTTAPTTAPPATTGAPAVTPPTESPAR